MYLIDNIFNEIKLIIPTLTIKFDKEAKLLDTLETLKESDRYVSAILKIDSFNTYRQFDSQSIINAGVTNLELVRQYSENKLLIPYNLRDIIIEKQRELIISNYVEKNNYYRTLNGLPDIDTSFIYLDEETCTELNLEYGVPIHEYSIENINVIKNVGLLETLKNNNPNKKYLNFLGSNKIDISFARQSKNFSILQMTKDISDNMYIKFNEFYNQSREYFMTVIYIKEYSKTYDLYDNFIALCIIFMTIQRTFSDIFKSGITRDFYDLESIKMMFDSYNVPFISYLSLEHQRVILKNLNNLLRYKSTDKVLYDLCSLLDFERVRIFSYYLIKQHNLDESKNPLFLYKEEDDGLGNITLVEDAEKMYSLYFQLVDISERNIALALENNNNKLDYDEVIINDPYWVDEEVKAQLYKEDFNFIETKYLNIQIMYKMTEMLFEVIYFLKMLIDKKTEVSNILIKLPKIFSNTEFEIFNVVIFLIALVCKKNKMVGNILYSPSKILSVMGFNFKSDFNTIRQYINNNSDLIDVNILSFIENLNVTSAEDVNSLYSNIRNLNDFIITKLATCQNIDEYRAYMKLFNTLMISNETNEMFTMSNGEKAITFLEYLQNVNINMYNIIFSSSDEKISEYITHTVFRLNKVINELKYTDMFFNDSNTSTINALIKLIDFFKSYTTDITSLNIVYLMNSRYFNMIRLIHDIKSIDKILDTQDNFNLIYKDNNASFSIKLNNEDKILLIENFILLYKELFTKDNIINNNKIISLNKNIVKSDLFEPISIWNLLKTNIIKKYFSTFDIIKFLSANLIGQNKLNYNDNCSKNSEMLYETNQTLIDILNIIKKTIDSSYKLTINDIEKITSILNGKDKSLFNLLIKSLIKNIDFKDNINIINYNNAEAFLLNKTSLLIKDNINIIREL